MINTQIANALATHTDLSPQARNNLQQVTAMVAGATAGNLVGSNTNSTVQGANTGLASEVFNRQLHPKELQQIHDHVKEFAKQQGITEEEAKRQLTEETAAGSAKMVYKQFADLIGMVKGGVAVKYGIKPNVAAKVTTPSTNYEKIIFNGI